MLNPLHGDWYFFWSGVGNDIPIYLLGILPAFVVAYKHRKCHVHYCPRLGHYPFKHYKLCKRHHPQIPNIVTQAHIKQLHKQSLDNSV